MMAPHYERARILHAAIETAVQQLSEPIDLIKVTPRQVLIWAAGRQLAMRYHYANSYDASGTAMLGGGHWVLEPEPTRLPMMSWGRWLLSVIPKSNE
jgi:hypothetical protein